MDVGKVLDGLLLLLGALFGVLTNLASYTLSLLGLLVSPLLYLAHSLLTVALFPLRILAKFEAFLLFITAAVLIGVTVGLCLHFTSDALSQLLHLYSPPESAELAEVLSSKGNHYDWESKMKDARFMSSTILEEDESTQVSE